MPKPAPSWGGDDNQPRSAPRSNTIWQKLARCDTPSEIERMCGGMGWTLIETDRLEELERLFKVACYDCDCLQKRLDAIRSVKERLIHLIEHPTLTERLDAMGPDDDVMDVIMGRDNG